MTVLTTPLPTEDLLPQYSAGKVIALWALAALPMAVLGWVLNPWLAESIDGVSGIRGTTRVLMMTAGLVWQCTLALLIVRREAGSLSWPVLCERLRLQTPCYPGTRRPSPKMWWWLALLIPLFGLSVFVVSPPLDHAWVAAFPALAEPPAFSFAQIAQPPGSQALAGAWWFYGLFLVMLVFNTVLGEEFLFRGILLPRMEAAFGQWHWLANGVVFGVYHLHQPWGMPRSIVDGVFLFALPAAMLRSTWISIAVHSTQSVFFALVLMPLVFGRG